jgi:hypothetical protein
MTSLRYHTLSLALTAAGVLVTLAGCERQQIIIHAELEPPVVLFTEGVAESQTVILTLTYQDYPVGGDVSISELEWGHEPVMFSGTPYKTLEMSQSRDPDDVSFLELTYTSTEDLEAGDYRASVYIWVYAPADEIMGFTETPIPIPITVVPGGDDDDSAGDDDDSGGDDDTGDDDTGDDDTGDDDTGDDDDDTTTRELYLEDAQYEYVGEGLYDRAAETMTITGDLDGDGLHDLVVGAQDNSDVASMAGKIYIVLSSSVGASGSFSLTTADHILHGIEDNARAGTAVADAGDVDGDGLHDLIVGAALADAGGVDSGAAYLLFGSSLAGNPVLDLPAADHVFVGEAGGDNAGNHAAGAGDVDGDGLADLLIGADSYDDGPRVNAGKAYLVLGSTLTTPGDFGLAGADYGFVGEEAWDYSGEVATAGDVDGDGLDDLLIGAPRNSQVGSESGKVYLFLAANLPPAPAILADASADFAFLGEAAGDWAGYTLAGGGDVDGDGLDDLLIGAPEGDRVYLIVGSDLVIPGPQSLSDAHLVLVGEANGDRAGDAITWVPDVGGDGRSELLIGAPGNTNMGPESGRAYLYYSASLATPGALDLADAHVVFNGAFSTCLAGDHALGSGDVDGDGSPDLLMYGRDGATWYGAAYLFMGW